MIWGKGSPSARPSNGAGAGLSYSTNSMRSFQQRAYLPSESMLIAVGPFSLFQVLAETSRAFGDWAAPPTRATVDVPETLPTTASDGRLRITALRRPAAPVYLTIAAPCTGVQDPDDVVFEVLSQLLEGYTASSVMHSLRVERGDGAFLHANCSERRTAGTFTIDFDTSPTSVEKSLGAVLASLERLRTSDVDPHDLEIAEMRYLGLRLQRFSNGHALARALAFYFTAGLGPEAASTLEARVRAVTPARVGDVARRYLSPPNLALVAVGDPSELAEPLGKLGSVTWVDAVEDKDLPSQYWGEQRE
jgi:predicted Zn-dependent peptidase